MGPRAGLDRCGKSRPHRDLIPGPSRPQPVAIPTELPGPQGNARIPEKPTHCYIGIVGLFCYVVVLLLCSYSFVM